MTMAPENKRTGRNNRPYLDYACPKCGAPVGRGCMARLTTVCTQRRKLVPTFLSDSQLRAIPAPPAKPKVLKGRRKPSGILDGWLTAACTKGTHLKCWSVRCACWCHKHEGAKQ